MSFSIQPNGIVSTVGVKESTIGDTGLESCIGSRIKSWVFPKPEAPVVTEVAAYPFYLNPANESPFAKTFFERIEKVEIVRV
mgnify:CR=1 FL=1